MKKSFLVFAAAALAGVAFGAANDAMIEFSTKGPDTYADGSPVLDGECYALVWMKNGAEGLTIAADGSTEGGEIVLAASLAKDKCCPTVYFEVNADDLETKYVGGSWGVYLLDTRRWGADGSVKPAGTVNGKVRLVNAAGKVPGSVKVSSSGSSTLANVTAAAVASGATAVPEGAPKPEITGFRVEGANVFVTVRGTVPYLQYGISTGATPDSVVDGIGDKQTGAAAVSDEIILVAPAKAGGAFFRVDRN